MMNSTTLEPTLYNQTEHYNPSNDIALTIIIIFFMICGLCIMWSLLLHTCSCSCYKSPTIINYNNYNNNHSDSDSDSYSDSDSDNNATPPFHQQDSDSDSDSDSDRDINDILCSIIKSVPYLNAHYEICNNTEYIDKSNTICTVCLDELNNNEVIVKLNKCQHYFHKECITPWLMVKKTCPICRIKY